MATAKPLGELRRAAGQAAAREMIATVARDLFLEKGYDAVTLDEVADACGVSVRTVLRYFSGKEPLALAKATARLDAFRNGLAERTGDVLTFWRAHVMSDVTSYTPEAIDALREEARMIAASPALVAYSAGISARYERALADAFTDETEDRGFGPRLLASVLVHGNLAAFEHSVASGNVLDSSLFLAVIDYAAETVPLRFPPSSSRARKRSSSHADRRRAAGRGVARR